MHLGSFAMIPALSQKLLRFTHAQGKRYKLYFLTGDGQADECSKTSEMISSWQKSLYNGNFTTLCPCIHFIP